MINYYTNIQNIIDPCLKGIYVNNKIIRLLRKSEYYKYFFKELQEPEWLPVLEENGLLKYQSQFGSYYIPFDYLIRCLNKGNDYDHIIYNVIQDIFIDFKGEQDIAPINFHRFTKICGLISSKYTTGLIEPVLWCLEMSKSKNMVIDQIPLFLNNLYKGEFEDGVFKIFKKLYSLNIKADDYFHLKDPIFGYDSYMLDDIFKKTQYIIIQSDTKRYFDYLLNQYNKVLTKIYPRHEDDLDWDDRSFVNRPSIEDSDQNRGHSDQDTLINMLRTFLVEVDTDERRVELVSYLLKYNYPIFRRLALYSITEFPELINLFEDRLLTTDNLFNTTLQHEIHRLLKLRFSELKTDNIESIVSSAKIEFHRDIDKENRKKLTWEYQLGLFLSIQENSYSEEREKTVKELEKKLGYRPQHPDYPYYSYSSTGFDSPITVDEISKKSWKEVKVYLLGFDEEKAQKSLESRPEYEGLARTFSALIRKNTNGLIENINLFKDVTLRSSYISVIPETLVPQDNVYKQNEILACVDYLKWMWQKIESNELELSPSDSRYSLKVGFNRLFTYLYGLFNNDQEKMSETDITVIKALLEQYNPDIVKEELEIGDPYQGFINRTKGEYLHAWFALNLRLKRQNKIDGFLDEFRAILDKGIEQDEFVHVLLGRFLSNIVYIDKDWVDANIDHIFPKDTNPRLWEYSMKGFLWSTSWPEDQFSYLLPNLKKACELSLSDSQKQSLAERIGVFYIRKRTHLSCFNDLIKPLVESEIFSTELSNSLIYFFGNVYDEPKNGNYIRKYVSYRFKILNSIEGFDKPKELIQFVNLYKCFQKLTDNSFRIFSAALNVWTDESGNPRVLMDFYKYLREKKEYEYLIKLLNIEFKNRRRWGMMYKVEYKELFTKIYEQRNTKYQKVLNKIIISLGEQGFYEFRELYEEYGMK